MALNTRPVCPASQPLTQMVEQQHCVLQHGQLRGNKGWKAERRMGGAGSGAELCMVMRQCHLHRPVLQHRQLSSGKSMSELASSRDGLLPTLPRGGSSGTGQRRAAQHSTALGIAQRSTAQHSAAQRGAPGSCWPWPRPCCPAAALSAWPAAVNRRLKLSVINDKQERNNSCGGCRSGCINPAARAVAATAQQHAPPTCPVQTQYRPAGRQSARAQRSGKTGRLRRKRGRQQDVLQKGEQHAAGMHGCSLPDSRPCPLCLLFGTAPQLPAHRRPNCPAASLHNPF